MNNWHSKLACYLVRKPPDARRSKTLKPLFGAIDDEAARFAANQLILLESGHDADEARKHNAANTSGDTCGR